MGLRHPVDLCGTATWWRRLIGSPKLQIIFHTRATKYRSLLREMTSEDQGSYESSPPCVDLTFQNICQSFSNLTFENICERAL